MNLLDNYKKNSFEEIFYPNVPFENSGTNLLWGYLLSLKMLIFTPFIFFKTMHVNKGYTKPAIFALINIILAVTGSNLYMYLNLIDTPAEQLKKIISQSAEMPEPFQKMLANMSEQLPEFSFNLANIALQSLGMALNLMMLIMIWQTALAIFRLADNGLQATWRVGCYASVVLLINLLPVNQLLTNTIIILSGFLLMIIGLSEAHELTWKRTMLAALSLPVVLILFFLPMLLLR